MIRIATRASPLALKQADIVRQALQDAHGLNHNDFTIVSLTTKGDQITNRKLIEIGGKGLFTKEIEDAVLDKRADIAVHSMKDMASVYPQGLVVKCVLQREDPCDAWICPAGYTLEEIPADARVGTASLRRASQVLHVRPDLQIVPLRGNVGTRLRKINAGEAAATLLAMAGLKRLGMQEVITKRMDSTVILPAVAQGAIGVQCRANDSEILQLLRPINHPATFAAVNLERAFLLAVDGSCRTPVAAYATIKDNSFALTGLLASEDGVNVWKESICGPVDEGEKLGYELGIKLKIEATT